MNIINAISQIVKETFAQTKFPRKTGEIEGKTASEKRRAKVEKDKRSRIGKQKSGFVKESDMLRDFDPHRIASEWHSGQGSALYAYSSTDRIPTEEFKERLVSEIEHSMAGANDDGLDELEYLLMHVEEQHPDQFPDSSMREAWGTVNKRGEEQWSDDDDADIRDLYLSPEAFNDSPRGAPLKDDMIVARPKAKREEDAFCEICGGNEGVCECAMTEEDEPSSEDFKKYSAAVRRGQIANKTNFSLDNPPSAASFRTMGKAGPTDKPPPKWVHPDHRRVKESVQESSLRLVISRILGEMKLSVAGGGHFNWDAKDEPSDSDDDELATFLLKKKKDESEPEEKKSSEKLGTSKKRGKSSQFR